MDRLGGITPKTLTQRLRELAEHDIVRVDREPGRREVRYALTDSGRDLVPVVDALNWWGLRHAWRWPRAGEPLHAEHLLRSVAQAAQHHLDADEAPARWRFRMPSGVYLAEVGVIGWSLTDDEGDVAVDVTVTASVESLAAFIFTNGVSELDGEVAGAADAVARWRELIDALRVTVNAE